MKTPQDISKLEVVLSLKGENTTGKGLGELRERMGTVGDHWEIKKYLGVL